eukprot:TRINITY_DN4306_c0_g2_i1.p1 TRINITY_DN4306_c0_g2~~TRINITY_DN4306_c0_g2_i1.p1  ORF type:complete len:223 (-),score=59.18 TRINITY_DN4306_c0_g2_i1:119-739(-)
MCIRDRVKDVILRSRWTFWESYKQRTGQSFEDSLKELIYFDKLSDFSRIWNNFPHKTFTDLIFYDDRNQELKEIEVEDGRWESIDGLCLFRDSVKPQWEEEINKNGAEFRFTLSNLEYKDINLAWEKTVFALVGETFPDSEKIVGLRFMNKLQAKEKGIRIEVWVSFNSSNFDLHKKMENALYLFFDQICGLKAKIASSESKDHKK